MNRRLPLLEPMSEIAGRMSMLVGGYFLAKHFGGSGVLLGGVPGVLPGKVVVLGGGASGINAARMAQGLGADVTILEVDLERMRFLDITLHTAHTLVFERSASDGIAADGGFAHRRGARAGREGAEADHAARCCARCGPAACWWTSPSTRAAARKLRAPTTHHNPVYVEEGVTHYCVANMPGAYARTATQALTNVTYRYIEMLADLGLAEACQKQPALLGGINVKGGKVTHKAVAEAHGLPM